MDCFVRQNIEVFTAKLTDVEASKDDRRHVVSLNQVGFRCIHCASSGEGAKGAGVFYPLTIESIFDAVRNFQKHHFDKCESISKEAAEKYRGMSQCGSLTSVLRRYYILSAKAIGLSDSPEGIRMASPQRMYSGPSASAPSPPSSRQDPIGSIIAPKRPSISEDHNSAPEKSEDSPMKKQRL